MRFSIRLSQPKTLRVWALGFCLLSLALLTIACSARVTVETAPASKTASSAPANTPCPTSSGGAIEICPVGKQVTATVALQVGPLPEAPTQSPTPLSPTASPTFTPLPLTPTPCAPELCTYSSQFFLARPIAAPGNDSVDQTYPFGSTQSGWRDPHHGVEFLNAFGTPVLAAADGTVVVAGEDREPTSARGVWPITYYGPYSYFYGNLVIIEHSAPAALLASFPNMPQPDYTLYAHLSEIEVQVGQQVTVGQQIGKVGMSGIAEGSHLHFEVRLGKDTYSSYKNSLNPELWLAPHQDKNGQLNGALAGQFLNVYGTSLEMPGMVLEYLPDGPEQPASNSAEAFEIHLVTYEEKTLVGQSPWQESFAVGDLPAGWYRLSYPHDGLQQMLVQILPGQLTMIRVQFE